MIVVLLSLIPLFGWGAGDYIAARGARIVNAFTLSFYMMIIGFLVTVPISLSFGAPDIYAKTVLTFFASSICFNAGFLLMLRGFHYGPVGIVAPIANSYALVTTIYALLFQGLDFSAVIIGGILVIITGIGLVSYSTPKPGEFKDMRKTLLYAVLAHVIFGIGFVLLDIASTQSWNQNTVIVQCTGFVVAGAIWLILQRKNKVSDVKKIARYPIVYIGGAAGGIGLLGMNAALARSENVAIPTAVAAAAPLVTALLAYIFDHEHLTVLQRTATALIVSGIVLLSI